MFSTEMNWPRVIARGRRWLAVVAISFAAGVVVGSLYV